MTIGRHALLSLAAISMLLGSTWTPAWSQELNLNALLQRLDRLDRDLASVQRLLATEGVPASALEAAAPTAASDAQGASRQQILIDQWEEQIRLLTGQVEEAQYQIRQLTSQVANATADVETRLAAIEQKLTTGSVPLAEAQPQTTFPQTTPSPETGTPVNTRVVGDPVTGANDTSQVLGTIDANAPTDETSVTNVNTEVAVAATETPEAQYDQAYRLLAQTDYAAAEGALQAFISGNPEHTLSGNAYYWLGETYYVRNDFPRAAVAFARGYKGFPQGSKAADNLLKLGMSFAAMEKAKEACATFDKLGRDHSDAPPLILDRLARERGRANCG